MRGYAHDKGIRKSNKATTVTTEKRTRGIVQPELSNGGKETLSTIRQR